MGSSPFSADAGEVLASDLGFNRMWFSLSLEYGRVRRKEVDVSKTTYILIPGAGGDAWYWQLLTDHLEVRGHEVLAVSLPASDDSAGWAEYADTIVGAIGDRTGVILVAQSLGGFSAPLACVRVPVELLVLLNAMIPRPGETGAEWWSNTGQQEAMHAQLGALGSAGRALARVRTEV
jgi:Alpha/beta hydrolase family